jgi:hypothetical protein
MTQNRHGRRSALTLESTLAYFSVSELSGQAGKHGAAHRGKPGLRIGIGYYNVTVSMRTLASIEKPRRAEAERCHCQGTAT